MKSEFSIPAILTLLACGSCAVEKPAPAIVPPDVAAGVDWPYYNGSPGGTHYSSLSLLNTKNVRRLKLAWTYDTKDELGSDSTFESNPLVVNGRLYFISPLGRLLCLDAATGKEMWAFNPAVRSPGGFDHWRRGVSYWESGGDKRILFAFADDLYAVDANTGSPLGNFGIEGRIPLGGRVSSPAAVFNNLIIVGGSASSIRAFDAVSGRLRWVFNTIPRPGEFGYDTWPPDAWKTAVGANNWGGMTVDVERGIVFVPLAFPQDFYGAQRAGDNLYANCLIAVDANTGRRLWHFQTIRHDLWDWDLPAPPALVRVKRNGKLVDAVAQVSKVGYVYVLDRDTGASLFPLKERAALPSDIPGVATAPTQIEPLSPAPFVRQGLSFDSLTKRTPAMAAAAADQFHKLSSRGLWDPPSTRGTILLPGGEGGAGWGGAAVDPETSLLYVNATEMPWVIKLRRLKQSGGSAGADLYQDNCAKCHGELREGYPPDVPSLVRIAGRLTSTAICKIIRDGSGRMPSFPLLADNEKKLNALLEFLQTLPHASQPPSSSTDQIASGNEATQESEYVIDIWSRLVDADGYPLVSPPWGTLSAIDLNSGEYRWRIPFGEYPELTAKGLANTGSENYGGAIVTGGGLLFIGATSFDRKFRAYDKLSGKLLWETQLPAAANATPATYVAKGRQFVVIAAGGGRSIGSKSGSTIHAFSLPD